LILIICIRIQRYHQCSSGSFNPSGYLLKAAILHSGDSVLRRSDYARDALVSELKSFRLPDKNQPTMSRGYGALYLNNLLPSSLRSLFVKDAIALTENQVVDFIVKVPKDKSGIPLKVGFNSLISYRDTLGV